MKPDASRSRNADRGGPPFDLRAPQLLVLSFAVLTTIGWLGFMFLPGLYEEAPMSAVDALFIAASAVCVTGLSTVDLPVVLSFGGELWLLALIQAGGLGILTFAAVVAAAAGRRAGLDVEEAAGSISAILPIGTPRQMLRTVIGVTLACEGVGAIVLFGCWWNAGEGWLGALWLAVFHAVSAFCNAGFSLFSDSMVGQQRNAPVLIVLMGLILLGGIGFPVLHDLRARWRGRRRLTTHTRIVLVVTLLLIVAGSAAFLTFEWDRTLFALDPLDRVVNAIFMAITPRTAGFNSVDYGQVSNDSILLTLALMWIGGGSGSVAGGAKVTTIALLALLMAARLRGDRHVSIAGRTVPDETVNRATGLAVGMVLLLFAFTLVLLQLEPSSGQPAEEWGQMVRLAFEVQSALSTVGLSIDLTGTLGVGSKLVLVLVMLLGRVGPLAVLGAMVQRAHHTHFRYPHEDVLIG
ncbi:MAG: potassium transporter TrkG [Myxococcota bacterium]